ncbi:MAG: molybdopterin-dependent oxidoreductase [Rhodospirillales bacterium]|nr:molybdopterin-dependent oxidoreductase [Rhodospirillales bacterium]
MSDTALIPHAAHWGAFLAETRAGRMVAAHPVPQDPAPSAILSGMAEAVHAANRIDQPYVRAGWLAGDRAGGTPRGGERFVPLSWDRAIALVAGEIARVRETHGPASIFGGSYGWSSAGRFHHAKTQLQRLLAAAGGFTGQIHSYSYATGQALLPHLVGDQAPVVGPVVDWRAIERHAKLLVCFGGIPLRNGQIINGGGVVHDMGMWLRRVADAGVRIVNISPLRADLPGDIAADWVPIRPGTDAALMLAIAHTLIRDGAVDHAFLDRCTEGYATLRDEVLGCHDGVEKTPAWAAAITGVPAETISALARDCAANPTMLTAAWSLQRAEFGEQPYWMVVALAAMLGGIGKPGQGFGFGHGSIAGMGSPHPRIPSLGMRPLLNRSGSFIPVARLTDMLEKPGQDYDFNGRRQAYPDIRLIAWAGGNPFHHHQDLNRLLRAWARAETIVVTDPWWTATARHADIVLPATTTLERNDIACSARDRFTLAMKQVLAPQGQARDDFAIYADIAEALQVRAAFTEGRDQDGWLRHLYGEWRAGAARAGIAVPEFDAFWTAGRFELPDTGKDFVPFADFVRDPAAHPLNTESGRIQIASARIAGFGYADCPGHPVWRAPREYLGAPLAARFPLHLLSVQPSFRLHGQMDGVGASAADKIAGREPITLHPADAAQHGLAAGDVVRVFNDRGACLAGLRLDDGMLRGVAVLATGAWFDPQAPGVPGSLCVHGNPNVLTQDVGTSRLGQGPVAQSCLVEVEAFRGALPEVSVGRPPPGARE